MSESQNDSQGSWFSWSSILAALGTVAAGALAVFGYRAGWFDRAIRVTGATSLESGVTANQEDTDKIRNIGLAMHNYHDIHSRMPADSYDANGRPLLSWRVHILPYIEQDALYREFHLDEPWDSPHNRPLMARMPAIFAMTGTNPANGRTTVQSFTSAPTTTPDATRTFMQEGTGYTAIVSPGSNGQPSRVTYQPRGATIEVGAISDGTSNTVMVAEAAEAVEWTRPGGDIRVTPGQMPSVGGARGRNPLVGFADGSVQQIPGHLY